MTLVAFLLSLKLMTVFIQPENPTSKDDQTLATCAAKAMTARPTSLTIAATNEPAANTTLIVGNHAGVRIHVTGKLVKSDGTVLIEVNHVTHGFNHGLCHQMDGLLDEMAKKLSEKK